MMIYTNYRGTNLLVAQITDYRLGGTVFLAGSEERTDKSVGP